MKSRISYSSPRGQRRNPRGWNRNGGFTLIEVVLAIALTATVVYLLSTATELYLVNVDASRARVESSQLARTLLDQIAADLAATRTTPPAASQGGASPGGGPGGASQQPGGAGGQGPGGAAGASAAAGGASGQGGATGGAMGGGGPGGGGPMGGSSAPGSSQGPAAVPGSAHGVFGNADQIRVDRAAYADWERASREVDSQEAVAEADLPVTVRYFLVDRNRVSTQRLAQQGVAKPYSTASAAGLYRETIPTAALQSDEPPLPARDQTRAGAQAELLAPEVVALAIAYYNGVDLVEEWDPTLDGGLPRGVEITLTVAEPRFRPNPNQEEQQRLAEGRYLESEMIQYRRFVRLPLVAAGPPAQPLMPAGGQGGGARAGQGQSGQPGQSSNPGQGASQGGAGNGGSPGGGP